MSPVCASAAFAPGAFTYRRREPQQTPLHQVIRDHLEPFLAGRDVPAYVQRALRRYLDCGVLAKGFVRVHCDECGEDALVAFSCKDRGFCPSCTARRAAETAAHLVDAVLPHVPLRQWVLALPFDLHRRVARDAELEGRILALFVQELRNLLRTLTGTGDEARSGSVTLIQRFGSTLNLHLHFHLLSLDGVYVPGDGTEAPPRFVRAPPPTQEQLQRLVQTIAQRVRRLTGKAGEADETEPLVQQPLLKVYGDEPNAPPEPRLCVDADGFNLHAATAFEAHERVTVERWCRYALRGPIANARIEKGPRDTLVYTLKTPKPDGTTHVVFTPTALLERLVWLIPLPGHHLVRYHGVLASSAQWRPLVVPAAPSPPPDELLAKLHKSRGTRRIAWADLIRRVFALELLVCACGGRRRVIATIEEGPVAQKILRHLGLPSAPPLHAPAQSDQLDLWDTGPPDPEWRDPPSQDD